jgi:transcriptional regulator with XRE-family HTH domain
MAQSKPLGNRRAMTEVDGKLARAVGERIAAVRRAAGLSQQRLGEMCDRSQTAVGHYESGRALPSLDVLIRIATVTGTTVAMLSGEADEFGILDSLDSEILRRWRRLTGVQKFQLIGWLNTNLDEELPNR